MPAQAEVDFEQVAADNRAREAAARAEAERTDDELARIYAEANPGLEINEN